MCSSDLASVVNALSTRMEVEVKRNGNIYKLAFEKGEKVEDLHIVGESKKTGSKTVFWADESIFDETEYDYETLEHRLREMAFLNKGIRITLIDKRSKPQKKEEFCYEGGIKEFVAFQNKTREAIHKDIVYYELEKKDKKTGQMMSLEVAFQYTDRYSEVIMSYANNINTTDGGYHLVGFKTALTKVFNDYAKKNKILKDNDPSLTGEDVREGITAVVSIKLTNPQFEGQTKAKLGNIETRGFVESTTNEYLTAFLQENPNQANLMI